MVDFVASGDDPKDYVQALKRISEMLSNPINLSKIENANATDLRELKETIIDVMLTLHKLGVYE
jgi:mannitol/fructose-specific phosphotransferase system IIA component (Ntr-type)